MPVILYFASILLTCALSGFLAFYAWRHRSVPGSRACAGFLLGEGLLALAEILSMLSPTPAQALFWFKVRYLFLAAIPVFWLVFALEYSGRKYLLSKRLLAGMFIVPAISQIMLWSNNLHGLWIQQEVVFHKNGPFWIAEIGARVPHMGFLVNSFYGMILLLIGIVLLLINAWRMARQYRGQVILVACAASTAFVISHIIFFNLRPKIEFNLFTPGIGLSLLLITLAVFRFQFLKRAPAADAGSAAQAVQAQSERSLAVFLLIFIVMAAGIIATAYVSYKDYEQRYRRQVESNLSSIAALKVDGLKAWRKERMEDAQFLYHNLAFSALVQRYLENPGDAKAQAGLQPWLDQYLVYAQYDRVFLLDARGVERLSAPAEPEPVAAHLTQEITAILSAGQVTFLDFHRDTADGPIYLALLVPIFAGKDGDRPLGILVLRIDPHVYLYPYMQQWPVPSASAETLLIRREGADALYLNELKFQPNAALNLRVPLKNTENLAVKAVLGQVGGVEGMDYRGVPVIGDVRAVSGSPWFLVGRVDTAEVYAPLRERLGQTVTFFGLLIAASGATLGLVWRHQRARYYRGQVEAAQTLRESEADYRTLVENIGEGIGLADPQDQFTFANPAGEDIFGVPPGGLAGHSLREFTTPEQFDVIHEQTRQRQVGEKSVYETEISRPDGEKRRLLVTAVPQFDSQGEFAGTFGVFRDITKRKRAEDELRTLSTRQEAILDAVPDILMEVNKDKAHIWANPAGVQFFGEDVIGKEAAFYFVGEQDTYDVVEPLFNGSEDVIYVESWQRRKDGEKRLLAWSCRALKDTGGNVTGALSSAHDITERKHTEAVLRTSEERFRSILDNIEDGCYEVDTAGNLTYVNPALVRILGRPVNEMMGMNNRLYMTPEGGKDVFRAFNRVFRTGIPEQALAWDLVRPDGTLRSVEVSVSPIKAADGSINGFRGTVHDITERKWAEDALRESEVRYRTLVETSPDAIMLTDLNLNVLTVNRQLLQLFGFERAEEVIGHSALDFIVPEERESLLESAQKLLETGSLRNIEYKFVNGDGTCFPAEFNAVVVTDAEGQPQAFIAILRDITERKRTEESLRESEERYRRLVELLPDGVVVHSEGRVVFANPVSARIIGAASSAELTGMPVIQFVHPEYRELALKQIKQSLGEASSAPLGEEKFIRLDGTPIDVQVAAIPFSYAGKPAMLTVFNDITERKRAEEGLRESHELLERTFASLRDAVFIIDANTAAITDCNRAAAEIFGYSREHMLGRATGFLHVDQMALEEFRKLLLSAVAEKGFLFLSEFKMKRKDGTAFPTEHTVMPLKDEQGRGIGWVSVVRDITERKRAEEEIKKQLDELQRWQDATLGREMRILDLKRELNELLGQAGQPPRYPSAETK
jgi:PAS domain S-box-containing protein